MTRFEFEFFGAALQALPSGALFWPEQRLLVVSDLHFGKAARPARWGGALLPPYETHDTLLRLDADMRATDPAQVICLGDSFDAPGIDSVLPDSDLTWITKLQAGVEWIWIEGNHDPGPVTLGGTHLAELSLPPLLFRHIASGARGEVSGHYHPKARIWARGRSMTRACFLVDADRLILPAYGAYTGGLFCHDPALSQIMGPGARAILTGDTPCAIPMPREDLAPSRW